MFKVSEPEAFLWFLCSDSCCCGGESEALLQSWSKTGPGSRLAPQHPALTPELPWCCPTRTYLGTHGDPEGSLQSVGVVGARGVVCLGNQPSEPSLGPGAAVGGG